MHFCVTGLTVDTEFLSLSRCPASASRGKGFISTFYRLEHWGSVWHPLNHNSDHSIVPKSEISEEFLGLVSGEDGKERFGRLQLQECVRVSLKGTWNEKEQSHAYGITGPVGKQKCWSSQMHTRQQITVVAFTRETALSNKMEFSNSGIHIVWETTTARVSANYSVSGYVQYIKDILKYPPISKYTGYITDRYR